MSFYFMLASVTTKWRNTLSKVGNENIKDTRCFGHVFDPYNGGCVAWSNFVKKISTFHITTDHCEACVTHNRRTISLQNGSIQRPKLRYYEKSINVIRSFHRSTVCGCADLWTFSHLRQCNPPYSSRYSSDLMEMPPALFSFLCQIQQENTL